MRDGRDRWVLFGILLVWVLIAVTGGPIPWWLGSISFAVLATALGVRLLWVARRQWARDGRHSRAKALGLVYIAVGVVLTGVMTLQGLRSSNDGPKTVFITGLDRAIDPRQTIHDSCPAVTKIYGLDLDDSLDRAHGTIQYWNTESTTQRFKDTVLNLQTGDVTCP